MEITQYNIEEISAQRFEAEKIRAKTTFGKMWSNLEEYKGVVPIEDVKEFLKDMFIGTCVMMYVDYQHKRFMFSDKEK